MSKLFKLKRWLTIAESAKHLTTIFGEEVTEADILRFALDHRLTLSVVFLSGALASLCVPIKDEDVQYNEVPSLDGTEILKLPIGGQVVVTPSGSLAQVQDQVFRLDDDCPYSLSMLGGEAEDIQHRYWNLVGAEHEETSNLYGTFVMDAGRMFQLKAALAPSATGKARGFYPIGALPPDAALVVQTGDLLNLEKSIADAPSIEEKPIGTKERNTLLAIIAVLCKDAGYDLGKAAKTAASIQASADLMKISIGETTIEGHLKKARDAAAARMK
ncbi:hypothetical protein WKW79_14570 [Variovorax robiniae]|uniref:Phage protein n=1 Tax=Variovorax robiniae TaxID=1836199 RepID=A0ABU8X817_9BURK